MTAGVIFDLDGVLIDSEGLWHKATNEVLAEFGVVVSADEYRRINEAGQASDRWQAVLALRAALRASGGTTLRIPARRPRPSPFRRKSR